MRSVLFESVYAWLVPVCVHIAKIDLHTSTVSKNVTKILETTKNSVQNWPFMVFYFENLGICASNNVGHFSGKY